MDVVLMGFIIFMFLHIFCFQLDGFKSADHKMDDSDCICSTAQPHFDDAEESLEDAEGWEILSEIRDIEHAQLYNVPDNRQIMSNEQYDYAILIGKTFF